MSTSSVKFWVLVVIAGIGWVAYLDRPTRGNLKRALDATLPLL